LSFAEFSCGVFEGLNDALSRTKHQGKESFRQVNCAMETVVQVQFTGPGGIDFINPADDPRKK
jgi:hypothetical protein